MMTPESNHRDAYFSIPCIYYIIIIIIIFTPRDMIMSLENFIQTEKELLSLMVNLRSHFTPFLHSSDRTSIIKASVEGTVSGVIDEVSPSI